MALIKFLLLMASILSIQVLPLILLILLAWLSLTTTTTKAPESIIPEVGNVLPEGLEDSC